MYIVEYMNNVRDEWGVDGEYETLEAASRRAIDEAKDTGIPHRVVKVIMETWK